MIPSTHMSLFGLLRDPDAKVAAANRFADLYRPTILRWARRRCTHEADAEDVAQIVMVKMLQALPEYDPERGRFRSWLQTIVYRAAADFNRGLANRVEGAAVGGSEFQERLGRFPGGDALEELASSLSEATAQDALVIATLAKVRADTTEKAWLAFEYLFQSDRPATDVAAELGMRIGAVYQAKYRIRNLLEKTYSELSRSAAERKD